MGKIEGFKFIAADPETCHGSARIDGTRIAIWMIAQDITNGSSAESIKTAYSINDEVFQEVIRFIQQNRLVGYANVANR